MAKKGQQESKKTKNAKQSKSAADKTFGLKNKNKSAKVQQYVAQVQSQTANAAAQKRKEAENARKAAEKKAAEAAAAEARQLFNRAMPQQKVDAGVDPKSVVCAYFKQGLCNKGSRCKFSHDLSVERKAAKRDLYSEERGAPITETEQSEAERAEQAKGNANATNKICVHFLEAVENNKYGWFWVCPNGDGCKYRHSLPPGYKLKTKEEQRLERLAAANAPKITLEDFIETERAKLPAEKTPITLETFTAWKEKHNREKQKERESAAAATGKKAPLTGRELMLSGKFRNDADSNEDAWDLSALRKQVREAETAA